MPPKVEDFHFVITVFEGVITKLTFPAPLALFRQLAF
jgi:hypothetical protein